VFFKGHFKSKISLSQEFIFVLQYEKLGLSVTYLYILDLVKWNTNKIKFRSTLGRKQPLKKRLNFLKVVNFDCRLQVNVFVGFILLEIDDTLSINTYLPR